MKTAQLKKCLLVLGVVNLILMLVRVVLSYCLVTVGPFGIAQPNEAQAFYSLGQKLSFLGESFQNLLTGNSIFQQKPVFAAAAVLPIFLSTIVFILLLIFLTRYAAEISEEIPQKLFRWAAAFSFINLFAVPVLAQDFWLSIAWGKMMAAGVNPYYADLPVSFMQDLPLDLTNNLRMTYGPLWASISAVIVWLSGGNTLIAAMVFKLLLVGAWVGSLYLVWKLLERYSLLHQCLGLAIFGWLPLSVTEISAEGHNDIMMVFFMLLWLYKLEKGKTTQATLALAASALIKYTTAPLFLVEILYLFISQGKPFKDSIIPFLKKSIIPFLSAGLLLIAVFAIFYRSPDFFASTSAMRDWHFFTPQEAVLTFLKPLKISFGIQYLPQIIFVIAAAYAVIDYIKFGSPEKFRRVILAVMTAILFSFLGHVWTWFLLWVIPLAALLPGSVLSRWNIGVAIVFPLAIIILQFNELSPFIRWNLTGLGIYGFAVFWGFLASRGWLSRKEITDQNQCAGEPLAST